MRLIDADALMDYCLNQKIKTVDCNDIAGFPTVEPKRERGKWIAVDDYFNRISGRCSACGWEAHMYEDDVVGMNYCPNCGADMRGEKNETD